MNPGITCPSCGESIAPRKPEVLRVGRVTMDTATLTVHVDGELRHVQRGKETAILEAMLRAPRRVFTRDNLLDISNSWDCESNALNVHIHRVRKAIGDALTIRHHENIGWSLELPVDA